MSDINLTNDPCEYKILTYPSGDELTFWGLQGWKISHVLGDLPEDGGARTRVYMFRTLTQEQAKTRLDQLSVSNPELYAYLTRNEGQR